MVITAMIGRSPVIVLQAMSILFGGNVGKVGANVGMVTYQWLERHAVPYDEIVFGKPYGDIYIDDLGHRYLNWDDTLDAIRERKNQGVSEVSRRSLERIPIV
jgi:hypothetical protein